jgi:hypothetical protein
VSGESGVQRESDGMGGERLRWACGRFEGLDGWVGGFARLNK